MVRRQIDPTAAELRVAGEVGSRLANWFSGHGRTFRWRSWRDSYRVAVTEILLQRTRAVAVERFLPRFFAQYPTWHALARADGPELEVALKPIGLQIRRAASLKALARQAANLCNPVWESLPGVGQYVSRAIAVGTSGASVAMVDTNFVRMLVRVFGGEWMADYRYDRRLQGLAQQVVKGASDPRVVNWAVLDLGALVCLPRNPHCNDCPLISICASGASKSPDATRVAHARRPLESSLA